MLFRSNRAMKDVLELAAGVARSDASVLRKGKTGTGKECIAHVIHQMSPTHRRHPFVAVNCAAIPEPLFESELFGHERGSFTGAAADRPGRFELAQHGTLFLDEIGELTPPLQVKRLRALQERSFERVGGNRSIPTDCRLVTATNRSLAEFMESGRFRADLYYRLNVVRIHLPPLRERAEDVPLLAWRFAARHARRGGSARRISGEAMQLLAAYRWPGNVRELENVIERACVTSPGPSITTASAERIVRWSEGRMSSL